MEIQFSAGNAKNVIENKITQEINKWQSENKLQQLLKKDASLWTNHDENNWMGWLEPVDNLSELALIEAFVAQIKTEKWRHIVLLGMGGSSLFPAMMVTIFKKENPPFLHVLDSTDPMQIKKMASLIELETTLFIISSKSGTTLESCLLYEYFYTALLNIKNNKNIGQHFIAITDPHTPLEALAKNNHFRAIFYGIPTIGGRYSALSNFGMLPFALTCADIRLFLQQAEKMRLTCLSTVSIKENPGVYLGIILGVCEQLGKNKITLVVSPLIESVGAWLEQLLAESTGKEGRGFIPVDVEPVGKDKVYGDDRLFVYIYLETDINQVQHHAIFELADKGFPLITIPIQNVMYLGAELFRWEIATAVASSIIGVDPFNQPNVEESKRIAWQSLNKEQETHLLNSPSLLFTDSTFKLFADLSTAHYFTNHLPEKPRIENYLHIFFSQLESGDYLQLSAFIDMCEAHMAVLQQLRVLIRNNIKIATTLGFGPRFLHSTGQAHKGGIKKGAFLQITCDYENDLMIPDRGYTFGKVIAVQAAADFTTLAKRSRPLLRIHLGSNVQAGLQQLYEKIKLALEDINNCS